MAKGCWPTHGPHRLCSCLAGGETSGVGGSGTGGNILFLMEAGGSAAITLDNLFLYADGSGGAALLVRWWSRFWMRVQVLLLTAFASCARARNRYCAACGARARCPRNDHRCAETDAARSALARGGAGDCLFKVNKSHRQSNIFSQQQKTVPHSAIAEAGRRRVPGQLPRALPPAGPRGRGGARR